MRGHIPHFDMRSRNKSPFSLPFFSPNLIKYCYDFLKFVDSFLCLSKLYMFIIETLESIDRLITCLHIMLNSLLWLCILILNYIAYYIRIKLYWKVYSKPQTHIYITEESFMLCKDSFSFLCAICPWATWCHHLLSCS